MGAGESSGPPHGPHGERWLSGLERHLWMRSLNTGLDNIAVVVGVDAHLDPAIVARSLKLLQMKYAVLRSRVVQHNDREFKIQVLDDLPDAIFQQLDEHDLDPNRLANRLLERELNNPFDLTSGGPYFRATLCNVKGGGSLLSITTDHVMIDGRGVCWLAKDLLLLVAGTITDEEYLRGGTVPVPPSPDLVLPGNKMITSIGALISFLGFIKFGLLKLLPISPESFTEDELQTMKGHGVAVTGIVEACLSTATTSALIARCRQECLFRETPATVGSAVYLAAGAAVAAMWDGEVHDSEGSSLWGALTVDTRSVIKKLMPEATADTIGIGMYASSAVCTMESFEMLRDIGNFGGGFWLQASRIRHSLKHDIDHGMHRLMSAFEGSSFTESIEKHAFDTAVNKRQAVFSPSWGLSNIGDFDSSSGSSSQTFVPGGTARSLPFKVVDFVGASSAMPSASPFWVNAVTVNGQLHLGLAYNSNMHHVNRMQQFIQRVASILAKNCA